MKEGSLNFLHHHSIPLYGVDRITHGSEPVKGWGFLAEESQMQIWTGEARIKSFWNVKLCQPHAVFVLSEPWFLKLL